MREADSADIARDQANADEAEMQHDQQRRIRGSCKARDLHDAIDQAWSEELRDSITPGSSHKERQKAHREVLMNDGEDTAMPSGQGALTPIQAAQILGLHEQTVRRMVREGKLAAFRAGARGGVIRIPRTAIARYIELHTTMM